MEYEQVKEMNVKLLNENLSLKSMSSSSDGGSAAVAALAAANAAVDQANQSLSTAQAATQRAELRADAADKRIVELAAQLAAAQAAHATASAALDDASRRTDDIVRQRLAFATTLLNETHQQQMQSLREDHARLRLQLQTVDDDHNMRVANEVAVQDRLRQELATVRASLANMTSLSSSPVPTPASPLPSLASPTPSARDNERISELTLQLEASQQSLTVANQQMDVMATQIRQLTKTSPISPTNGSASTASIAMDSDAVMIRNELLREENTHLTNDLDRVQRVFMLYRILILLTISFIDV
jgi:hypothetical protein